MRKLIAVGLTFCAALGACQISSGEMSESDRAAIEEAIRAKLQEYVDVLATLDPERMAPFYAEGMRYYPDEHAMDRDSLLTLIGGLGRDFRRYDVSNDVIDITPLSREAALAAVRFHTLQTDTLGVDSRVVGTVTWVWALRAGDWRIIHGQSIHLPDTGD